MFILIIKANVKQIELFTKQEGKNLHHLTETFYFWKLFTRAGFRQLIIIL
jgi:hypothetical protein